MNEENPQAADVPEEVTPVANDQQEIKSAPAHVIDKVKLTHAHGFIEEETGRHRFWKGGDVVADPAEVMLLINRGAPIEFVD